MVDIVVNLKSVTLEVGEAEAEMYLSNPESGQLKYKLLSLLKSGVEGGNGIVEFVERL